MSFFFRALYIELCGGSLRPFIDHPLKTDEKLFLLFDFTHNFKNLFNNWINKKKMEPPASEFPEIFGGECIASFNHLRQLHAHEENKPLKAAYSLTRKSLNPHNISRTSPQHALSKFVSSCLPPITVYRFHILFSNISEKFVRKLNC